MALYPTHSRVRHPLASLCALAKPPPPAGLAPIHHPLCIAKRIIAKADEALRDIKNFGKDDSAPEEEPAFKDRVAYLFVGTAATASPTSLPPSYMIT